MAKKKKYYVVWQGNEPGIYSSWTECQLQIKGYPNAKYKSFSTLEAARSAYNGVAEEYFDKKKTTKPSLGLLPDAIKNQIEWDSISVDAACSGNPGPTEYQGVDTKTKDVFFRVGPLADGNNNIGEFLALVHGLAYLQKIGKTNTPIYSDSKTARSWVRNKKLKSTIKKTYRNAPIFDLIDRALIWLKQNKYDNPILIWNTKEWGEIPADFGRK